AQLACSGGVALLGLVGERGVLYPRCRSHVDRLAHEVASASRSEERADKALVCEPEFVERADRRLTLLAQSLDARQECARGVLSEHARDLVYGDTRGGGEHAEFIGAERDRLEHREEDLLDRRSTRLGFDTERGER